VKPPAIRTMDDFKPDLLKALLDWVRVQSSTARARH
jgi:hypothetical protein